MKDLIGLCCGCLMGVVVPLLFCRLAKHWNVLSDIAAGEILAYTSEVIPFCFCLFDFAYGLFQLAHFRLVPFPRHQDSHHGTQGVRGWIPRHPSRSGSHRAGFPGGSESGRRVAGPSASWTTAVGGDTGASRPVDSRCIRIPGILRGLLRDGDSLPAGRRIHVYRCEWDPPWATRLGIIGETS